MRRFGALFPFLLNVHDAEGLASASLIFVSMKRLPEGVRGV